MNQRKFETPVTATATPADSRSPKRARITLLLVFALFAAPLVIAWVLNFTGDFKPAATTNHGTLVQPARPVAADGLVDARGDPVDPALFKEHWTLVYQLAGPCETACQEALYLLRQVRLAQGKNIDRVQRLLLLDAAPTAEWITELEAHYPGLAVARPGSDMGDTGFPVPGRIYLVDPLGNLMMEYAADAEPRGMIKDLERLLRISYVG